MGLLSRGVEIMATGQLSGMIGQLRRLLLGDGGELSDGQLLEAFRAGQDEAAFEALVRRHGPMVLGVCRRVLGDAHDAEDAFQATFLVLVQKAGSVQPPELVGHWLYGVAYRTALKTKALAARRRAKESQVRPMLPEDANTDATWADMQPLLDRELSRLPERYRVPLVLCDLEGKSRKEAAQSLGLPEGTLSSRLARGRELLGRRLIRQGVTLSSTALALAPEATSAAVPAPLVLSTVQAASWWAAEHSAAAGILSAEVVAITQGVLKAMFISKIKIAATLVLAIGILGAGVGVGVHQVFAERPDNGPVALLSELFISSPDSGPDTADEQRREADKRGDEERREKKGDAERGDREKAEPSVVGALKSIDVAKGTIAIRMSRDGGPTDLDLSLKSKDVPVTIDGKNGKLADLKEGMQLSLSLTADREYVIGIAAEGRTARGVIRSVDPAAKTVTLGGDGGQTYPVIADARITIDRNPAKLDQVKAGAVGQVKFSADNKAIVALTLGATFRDEGGERRDAPGIFGTVKAIEPGKQITLTVRTEGGEADRTLPLGNELRIAVGGRDVGRVEDVKAGMRVVLLLTEDRKTVVGIKEADAERGKEKPVRRDGEKEKPTLTATLKSADKNSITVTVRREGQSVDQTFPLGKDVTIGNLKPGTQVALTLSDDRKTVLGVREFRGDGERPAPAERSKERPGVQGLLKSVDAAKNRITVGVFTAREGQTEEQTFELGKELKVFLGRTEAKLADLKPGGRVFLSLSDDKKSVLAIRAVQAEREE